MPHFPTPLFPVHITAKAMEALNGFIVVHGHDDEPIAAEHLEPLRQRLTAMVDCFFPENGDQEEFTGADTVDGNDYIHPIKVAELAAAMGREMGLPRSRMIALATAAALMNLGYVALRRTALDVPRALSDEEREQHLRSHCAGSVTLLAGAGLAGEVMDAIGQHHERWDGSGYPHGLSGEATGEDARIIGVADAFVALRSYRPYRRAIDGEKALDVMARDARAAFDPAMVDVLRAVVEKYRTRSEPPVAVEAGRQGLQRELDEQSPAGVSPGPRGTAFQDPLGGSPDVPRPAYGADAPSRATPAPQHITLVRRAPTAAVTQATAASRPAVQEALPRLRRRRRGRSSMFGAGAYLDARTRDPR